VALTRKLIQISIGLFTWLAIKGIVCHGLCWGDVYRDQFAGVVSFQLISGLPFVAVQSMKRRIWKRDSCASITLVIFDFDVKL
jgi:hypothetical protein